MWGFTGAVIAVPELWAAVDSDHVPWPTISGTVGYLEYWHTWVAVIIIGVLVWAVFHAVKYSGGVGGGQRTPGGRFTPGEARQDPLRQALAIAYYTRLPPGHYRFQVTACNEDGVWNDTGSALAVAIQPPFWRTNYWNRQKLFSLYHCTRDNLRRAREPTESAI